MLVYLALMIVAFLLMITATFCCKSTWFIFNELSVFAIDVSGWAGIFFLISYALTLLFFTLAACKQPGYIKNEKV